jgi:hypothetical protein
MNPWPYQGADRIANVALLDKSVNEQGYGLNGPQVRELANRTRHAQDLGSAVVLGRGLRQTKAGADRTLPVAHVGVP